MAPAVGNFGARPASKRHPRLHGILLALALALAAGVAVVAPAGSQQPSPGTYGPVRPADTLWDLALRFRGDASVTAQQAMIAILRANPGAFREGNINSLRSGVTLRVPSVADMAAITQEEAVAEFSRHEEAWRTRARTGTAAPAGVAPARAAPPPSTPSPAASEPAVSSPELEEQLEKVRSEVVELHKRLAERDEAIEELLVQLAEIQRELRAARAGAPPPSTEAVPGDEVDTGESPAARASWLPVSPLVLGSSLIVLLVLIVVVTLIRQRGEREDPHAEDLHGGGDDGDGGEESYADGPDGDDDRDLFAVPGEGPLDDDPGREPRHARARAAPATVAVGGAVAVGFEVVEEDTMDLPDDESTDLPIGIDLEGDEGWDVERGGDSPARPEEAELDDGPSAFGRHVEVGKLDELELDTGATQGSYPGIPADLDDEGSPDGGEPDRPGGGRRE